MYGMNGWNKDAGGDLISRAAAIDALDEIESEVADGYGFQYEKWRKYLCDLPSAQPEERTENRTETHACDCISREAAIDALDEIESEVADGYGFQYEKWREHFCEMPSAQPTDADIQKMQDIEQAMLDKAYECGKQDAAQWIPCSERLPEHGGWYIVTRRITKDNDRCVGLLWYSTAHGWEWDNAIAWMPLPEPYKEVE